MRNFGFTFIGMIVGFLICYYFMHNERNNYFELSSDFYTDNGGILKKGTLLKFQSSFPEGFSRLILYVNVEQNEMIKLTKKNYGNKLIPYWIYEQIEQDTSSASPCLSKQ